MVKKRKGFRYVPIPKNSARIGHEDEGISDNLGKSPYFRYSDRFLNAWYSNDLVEIQKNRLVLKK
jgi:hypothetical protein